MAMMKFREPNHVLWRGVRPAHDGTQVLEDGEANNSTVILYTVGAGKTFYLCGYSLGIYATAALNSSALGVYNAVPALVTVLHRVRTAVDFPLHITKSYWPPIEIRATYSVRLWSAIVTLFVRGCIHGWVE